MIFQSQVIYSNHKQYILFQLQVIRISTNKMMNSTMSLIGSPIKISGVRDLIHKYNNFFFDLDGVVWLGDQAIKGAIEALRFLKQQNKKLYYITNNSTRNADEVRQKFLGLGFDAQLKNIYTSSMMTAVYLTQRYPHIKYVAVVGTRSMANQIQKTGVKVLHIEHVDESLTFDQLIENHLDSNIQALIMAYDNNFTYTKLCLLSLYVQKGVKFIGSNPDKYTMRHGYRMPGCGSMLACVEAASGKKPEVVGKPNQFILDYLLEKEQLKKQECIMVGDNLQTDILFGHKGGIDTLCPLTGVTSQDVVLANTIVTPTYYSDRLDE